MRTLPAYADQWENAMVKNNSNYNEENAIGPKKFFFKNGPIFSKMIL